MSECVYFLTRTTVLTNTRKHCSTDIRNVTFHTPTSNITSTTVYDSAIKTSGPIELVHFPTKSHKMTSRLERIGSIFAR